MYIRDCELLINKMQININELKYMSSMCTTMYEKMFYDSLIQQEIHKMYTLKKYIANMKKADKLFRQDADSTQQTFTLRELAKFNGKNGNPAYIAVDGIVYDVTFEAVWAGGKHFGLEAGNDLSNEFKKCHEDQSILIKLKKIGVLPK
ncbi:cytochrome b5 domain-containing protein [Clostridium sp. ZS2-4]|uniref:cytochrome b5 domain-containing protein n=1 Tax=Clostridium sp. ZS2-4 TaxID=2987703 RepID=UPI00227BE1BE|nr:cytochrome b5 domain-containing protein [Clostridium sp. ZS2-4]MCY6356243.1 hypothetical protein [Clostridium sp. ZS2-4]